MILYRLCFVANFDFEEIEDIDPKLSLPNKSLGEDTLEWVDPVLNETGNHLATALILIGGTLIVTITLMNIFIAVLCDAYNAASRKKEQIFWQTRVDIVLE